MIAKRVIFEGRVQGVGFRFITKEIAMGFDVCGWVKNLVDGTVEMRIQGEIDEVEDFIKEIVEESTVAHQIRHHLVTDIDLMDDCRGFSIVH